MSTVSDAVAEVKSEVCGMIDALFQSADAGATPRALEEETWKAMLLGGRCVLGLLLASRARQITEQDIAERGLPDSRVHRRLDRDYWATVTTTFGSVSFPWFAYREVLRNGASATRNPAQNVLFPAFGTCRSSVLCLEWETRLGSDHPFRAAQEALTFFTHGAVSLEDTTIARHLVRLGQLVTRDDMYKTPDQIRQILEERATRDRETGRPLLYCSSDAHACHHRSWRVQVSPESPVPRDQPGGFEAVLGPSRQREKCARGPIRSWKGRSRVWCLPGWRLG
jgi:hypothetical protein